jgi:hypothetical protein
VADNEALTYLQMISPGELRPAPVPAVPLEMIELDRYSPLIRSTTLSIGRAHHWPSQSWGEEQWQAYLDRPDLRHWVAVLDGEPVGLPSLDVPPGGNVEIDTFGLLPNHVARPRRALPHPERPAGLGCRPAGVPRRAAPPTAPIPLPCRTTSGVDSRDTRSARGSETASSVP